VTGSSVLADGSFRFIPGPIFTNVLLVDEINRATPRTQSALLEAMQERQVSVDGETRPIPAPFLVLATQNPIELEGTFALPEAQLDRFLVRIALGYPGEEDERAIARRYRASVEPLEAIEPVLDPAMLPDLRDAARTATVSEEVEAYIVRLVRATREHPDLQLGASPRASVALYRAAQAAAFLAGRDFVLPDDVAALVGPVLTHRLVLDVDRELRGATAAATLAEIVGQVPVGVGAGIG
jgi:MoxR-like ATPase